MRVRIVIATVVVLFMLTGAIDGCFGGRAPASLPGARAGGRADPTLSNASVHSSEAVWDFSASSQYQTSQVTIAAGKLNLTTELNNTGNRWTRLADMAAGEQREDFSAAWDNTSGQMIIHGGYTDGGMMGPNWSQPLSSYNVSANAWARLGDAMLTAGNAGVWDPVDQCFVTHGGYSTFQDWNVTNPPVTGYNCSNATYAWYPSNSTWVNCSPGPQRYHQSAVWDPLHNIMLVFGGADTVKMGDVYNTTYYNDLWRYNITNDTWTKLAPLGTLPPVRACHTAVWDTRVGQMIVFGGANATATMNDTWVYNYTTNRWTKKAVALILPPARSQHAACWDSDQKVMMVTCGLDAAGNYLNDTWVYNATGNCWTRMAPVPGSGRAALAAVYDAINGQMMICGGRASDKTQMNETWAFKYIEWVTKCRPSGSVQSKAISLGDKLYSIDRVSWFGLSPSGANVTLMFRASNGNLNTVAFTAMENGSRPESQGRNIQWNLTLEPSADRLEGPEIGMVNVEYTVNNVPQVTAGPALQAQKREVVTINCSATDADEDPLTYNWTKISGPNATLSSVSVPEPSFTPQQSGVYIFLVVVNDSFASSPPANVTVTVVNRPPRANAGADQTGYKNETITFKGAATDEDGDQLTYEWSQVNGTPVFIPETNLTTLSFQPPSPGNYSFELVASDGEARSEPSRVSARVEGRQPLAVLEASSDVLRLDQSAELSANGSSDPDGKVARYFFDFGDGKDSGWTMRPAVNHTYGLPGVFNATLKVQDADGIFSEQSAPVKITVFNAPPVVEARVTPEQGNTSTQFRFSVTAGSTYDPDGTIAAYAWDFGDGGRGTGSTSFHVYKKKGDYQVSLRVTDDIGAYTDWTVNITVGNRAPVLHSWMPPLSTVMLVGEEQNFSASALDPESDDMTYLWKVDGEVALSDTSSFAYGPTEKGDHIIELTISDGTDTTIQKWTVTVKARPVPAKAGGNDLPLLPLLAVILIAACAGGGYFMYRRGKSKKPAGPSEAGQAAAVVVQSQNAGPPPGTRPATAYEIPDMAPVGYQPRPSPLYQQFPGPAAYQQQPSDTGVYAQQPAAPGAQEQTPSATYPQQPATAEEEAPMAVPIEEAPGAEAGGEVREAMPIEDDASVQDPFPKIKPPPVSRH
jgi:N-acetylneuraminic acid mutarotase